MDKTQLAAIRARAEAATSGPWVFIPYLQQIKAVGEDSMTTICNVPDLDERDSDFEFIAASREDVPALLDRIAELEAQNTELRDLIGIVLSYWQDEELTAGKSIWIARARKAGAIA